MLEGTLDRLSRKQLMSRAGDGTRTDVRCERSRDKPHQILVRGKKWYVFA